MKLSLEKEQLEAELEELRDKRERRKRKRDGPILYLNVGGRVFQTTRETVNIHPNSMLASMFSREFVPGAADDNGNWFIDRNPELFKHILEFLRTRMVPPRSVAGKTLSRLHTL